MAVWSLNRPEEHCNEGEVAVARHLQKLPDDWVIRWVFLGGVAELLHLARAVCQLVQTRIEI